MTYSLNTLNSSSAGRSPQRQAPTGFAHELLLVLGLLALVFWLLSFLSYSGQDAAWSTTGAVANAGASRNWCGRFGALLADASYFLFGFSAWWGFAAGLRSWIASFARWMSGGTTRRDDEFEDLPWWRTRKAFWAGLALLLCASTGLEWSRMYRFESYLPGQGGGVLGYLVGAAGTQWLGFTGSGLVGIVAMVAGIALVFRFSWGHVAERLGGWLYFGVQLRRARREMEQDLEAGRRAAQAREEEEEALRRAGHRAEPVLDDDGADDAVPVPPPPVRSRKGRSDKRASRAAAAPQDDDVEDVIDVSGLREISDAELAASAAPAAPVPPLPAAPTVSASGPADIAAPTAPAPAAPPVSAPRTAPPAPPVLDARIDPWDDEAGSPPWDDADEPAAASGAGRMPPPEAADPLPMAAAPRRPAAPVPAPAPVSAAGSDHRLPPVELLDGPQGRQETVAQETLDMTSRLIEKKLKDFGVQVRVVAAMPGPVITRYEIEPATGVKGSQVVNLAKDLARSLSLVSIRVIETIPGKNFMALELPNAKRQSIRLSEILGSQVYADGKSMLTMGLGKDIVGNPVVADLARMPHVLVAGTTGSGKSVGINAMILSLLYKAEARDVRLLMIDPKMLEMSVYEGIPHLLAPVVTDMKQAAHGLNWCVAEMERRYKLMSKLGVRNLAGFNAKIDEAAAREEFIRNPFSLTPDSPEPLERAPHIVVVIDELADLMMVVGKKIEELIARLAQKARAAGIHLILATQRPSVDVITGLIKANIPTRIAFQVSSKIDSRTILDQMGAEALLGMGDMLYMPSGTGFPVRVHGAFVSDEEVHRVVAFLKEQGGEPNYIEGVLEGGTVDGDSTDYPTGEGEGGEKDPMYDQAVEVVLKNRKASISLVQRHLKIGYNRAARLVEDMEKAGLVSSMNGAGQRDILVPARGADE